MLILDPTFIRRLKLPEDRLERIALRKALEATAHSIEEYGRYKMDNVILAHGYINTVRVLAETIKNRTGLDADACRLAGKIPALPAGQATACNLNPVIASELFLKLIKPNTIEL